MERNLLLGLPKDLIFHILSDLTTRDASRLSLVSKQVLNLMQERPNLSFDHHTIDIQSWDNDKKKFKDEYEYIVSSLDRYHRQNILLETFTLKVHELVDDRCIELAAETTGVRSLTIWTGKRYVLPKPVFEIESLAELELKNCELQPIERVAWPNLKRLTLLDGCKGSQEVFDVITRGCPLIENLQVHSYHFTGFNCNVANLRNLKHLNAELRNYDHRLEVDASSTPNLESIICRSGHVDLGHTKYPNLTYLELRRCQGIDDHFFTDFARKFPMLENLSLDSPGKTLERISLQSTSLKKIELNTFCYTDELKEACFKVPNLVCFKYSNQCIKILPELSFSGKPSGWRSCIKLEKNRRSIIDASWLLQLNEFLVALNGSESSVILRISCGSAFSNEKERQYTSNFRRTVMSSLEKYSSIMSIVPVREICIDTKWCSSPPFASAITDCIFLICQPQTITYLNCENHEVPIQFYEKLKSTRFKDHRRAAGFSSSRSSARFEDWGKFMEALQADENERSTVKNNISFHLEYKSHQNKAYKATSSGRRTQKLEWRVKKK